MQKTVRGWQFEVIGKETGQWLHLIETPMSQPVYFIEIWKSNMKNENAIVSP